MKAVKLLKIGRELLKLMSLFDLKVSDYKYVDLFMEYSMLRENDVKYTAAIMELSEKYHISESSVKRIIRRFEQEI